MTALAIQNPTQEAILEQPVLTIPQVADRLGVDRSTILRWIQDTEAFPNAFKKNPFLKTSPYVIPVSDVEHFERMQRGQNGK